MTGSLTRGALRPIAFRLTLLAILAIAVTGVLVAIPRQADAAPSVTVNSTGDGADADGGTNATCSTVTPNTCTLRAAIETANGGFADTILFNLPGAAGTINLLTPLPIIAVQLTIDASGNAVIVDGGPGNTASGFEVAASLNGQGFTLKKGTGTLRIRDIAGGSTDKVTGDAAVKVCGLAACGGGAADVNLGTVLVDGIIVSGVTGARGVHVVAVNQANTTVSNSTIAAPSDGVMLKSTGLIGACAGPCINVTDNGMAVTGSNITSTDQDAVDIEICDPVACDLHSKIAIDIDGNTKLEGGTLGGSNDDGVSVDVNINNADDNSSINVSVDNSTGTITGWDGVDIDVYADSASGMSQDVSVSGNQNDIIGTGGTGVLIDLGIDSGNTDSETIVNVNNNDDITGADSAVDIEAYVCCGDDNESTANVNGNGDLTGLSEDAVYVEISAGDGDRNENNVSVSNNETIDGTNNESHGVFVMTGAGAGDNGASTVQVNGNEGIEGNSNGVTLSSVAGDCCGDAHNNESIVEVNDNGDITGDDNDGGDGFGVFILSNAGDQGCCSAGSGNESSVDVNGNDDITGGEDAVAVISEAGTRVGPGNDNGSDVNVNSNGHLEGDNDGDGIGDGVFVASRAGSEDGEANNNHSTVNVKGDGLHDIIGGDDAVSILSEAGSLTNGNGDNNSSDVEVSGNRDIFNTASDNGVEIWSQAGAYDGAGDNNHVTAKVKNNRFITSESLDCFEAGAVAGFGFLCPGGNAIHITVMAGGADPSSDDSSTSAEVTGNNDIDGAINGIAVEQFVCCDSENTNDVEISQNEDIEGGDLAIGIRGPYVLGVDGVCCSQNTMDIVDNAGSITGHDFNSIDIAVEGDVPGSHTLLTMTGNDITGGAEHGVSIQNVGCCDDGADFSGSQIANNNISDNDGAGIFLNAINGLKIGPNNIIENNDGNGGSCCTGIHIVEWNGEADFNTITQNSIFDNAGLGIDLDDGNCNPAGAVAGCGGGEDTVGCKFPHTLTDGPPSDVDGIENPNACIPFPSGTSSVDKKLSGSACSDCKVEVFIADPTPGDQELAGTQYGEGKTYLGSATANGAGLWSFTIPCGHGGQYLTMTATGKHGSTSEFGPNFGPLPVNPCATPATNTPTQTNTPGGPTNTPTNTPTTTNTPTNTPVPTTGSIEVCKDTNPETDDGTTFDFDTDIPGMTDPDLEDDGCDIEEDVDEDDYTITETELLGWELDSIVCTGAPSGNFDIDVDAREVVIELEGGDDVRCTFTNVDVDTETASINICKETDPLDTGKVFDFESDLPDSGDFTLEDGDCEEDTDLPAGEYTINEVEDEDWNLTDISCTGTASANIDDDLDALEVIIDLQEGEDVECVFTNEMKTPPATLTPTPTATPVAPTNTPVPPTSTNTPVPPTSTATNTPVIPATPGNVIGDVNKNGVVNAIDAQLILQAEAFPNQFQLAHPKNADVNVNGIVNSIDAALIQQFVAGLIGSLPV